MIHKPTTSADAPRVPGMGRVGGAGQHDEAIVVLQQAVETRTALGRHEEAEALRASVKALRAAQ